MTEKDIIKRKGKKLRYLNIGVSDNVLNTDVIRLYIDDKNYKDYIAKELVITEEEEQQ